MTTHTIEKLVSVCTRTTNHSYRRVKHAYSTKVTQTRLTSTMKDAMPNKCVQECQF